MTGPGTRAYNAMVDVLGSLTNTDGTATANLILGELFKRGFIVLPIPEDINAMIDGQDQTLQ